VPELLQTAAYAQAAARLAAGTQDDDLAAEFDVDHRAHAECLRQRQQVEGQARYRAVLDESVLYRGPAAVKRAQLAHLAALATEDKAVIQVLPFAAGAMPPGSVSYLSFAAPLPSVAVVPSPAGTTVVDDRTALRACSTGCAIRRSRPPSRPG
jgi:hypothetical protein